MTAENLSPEELLLLVKKSFNVPEDQLIDMMPIYDLISRVADWEGNSGQEPMWLVEADEFFRKNFYNWRDLEKFSITHEDYLEMSIPQRAQLHNLFGLLGNTHHSLKGETQEQSTLTLLPGTALPKYDPSPASIIETAYSANGTSLLKAECTKCKDKTDLLPSREAFSWCEAHNQNCRQLP